MPKDIHIVWSASGGELDRAVVKVWHGKDADRTESEVRAAFINLLKTGPVSVGDTFTVEEV